MNEEYAVIRKFTQSYNQPSYQTASAPNEQAKKNANTAVAAGAGSAAGVGAVGYGGYKVGKRKLKRAVSLQNLFGRAEEGGKAASGFFDSAGKFIGAVKAAK